MQRQSIGKEKVRSGMSVKSTRKEREREREKEWGKSGEEWGTNERRSRKGVGKIRKEGGELKGHYVISKQD
jgi:hypothetical protein